MKNIIKRANIGFSAIQSLIANGLLTRDAVYSTRDGIASSPHPGDSENINAVNQFLNSLTALSFSYNPTTRTIRGDSIPLK